MSRALKRYDTETIWYLIARWLTWGATYQTSKGITIRVAKFKFDPNQYKPDIATNDDYIRVEKKGNLYICRLPKVVNDVIEAGLNGEAKYIEPDMVHLGLVEAQAEKFIANQGFYPFCNQAKTDYAHIKFNHDEGKRFFENTIMKDEFADFKVIDDVAIFYTEVQEDSKVLPYIEPLYWEWFENQVEKEWQEAVIDARYLNR